MVEGTGRWSLGPTPLRTRELNEFGENALSMMPGSKPAITGPMRTQPIQHGSIVPTLPAMPTIRETTQAPQPKQPPTRMEAVRAAKAKISRRNSLRKQRAAQKS